MTQAALHCLPGALRALIETNSDVADSDEGLMLAGIHFGIMIAEKDPEVAARIRRVIERRVTIAGQELTPEQAEVTGKTWADTFVPILAALPEECGEAEAHCG